MINDAKQSEKQSDTAFEKARLKYCVSAFDMQQEITESLDRKAKFFFSFITILLGLIFLKLDFIRDVWTISVKDGFPLYLLLIRLGSLLLFWLFLISALLSLLLSVRLRKYKNPYPGKIVDSLFAPDSDYLEKRNEESLLRKMALNYAIALEINTSINKKKAKWLEYSFFCTIVAICSFCIFLIFILGYYTLS